MTASDRAALDALMRSSFRDFIRRCFLGSIQQQRFKTTGTSKPWHITSSLSVLAGSDD